MKSAEKQEERNVRNILILGFVLVALIAVVVLALASGKLPNARGWFIVIIAFSVVCLCIILYSFAARILNALKEQADNNGFSLVAIKSLVESVRLEAAGQMLCDMNMSILTGDIVKFPDNIQNKINLLHDWMHTPIEERTFKDSVEFFDFLNHVRFRAENSHE